MLRPAELLIREALREDLPGVQRLYLELNNAQYNQPVPQDWAERFLTELHRYPGSALLVGLVDGVPVTTCTLIVIPNLTRQAKPYALIENVATHAAYRKRGFGTSLLREATRRAFAAGCYKVMLMTGAKDRGTLHFYEEAGFEQSKTGFTQMRQPA
jgi:ribosomal protein S18 acetylase RimI-like enzyme